MSYYNNHNHDYFSNISLGFPDVLCSTTDLIQRAYDLGLYGITITNHECLSGVVEALNYYNKMSKDRDFVLGLGNEIYLQTEDEFIDNRDNDGNIPYYHFVLTALDTEGYNQLCKLSTMAWERAFKKNIWRRVTLYNDLETVVKPNQGHIIASSACLGSRIDRLLLNNDMQGAIKEVERLSDIFGNGNFFLEIQPAKDKDPDQSKVNQVMKRLATEITIPLIVTTDSHYLCKEDKKAHSVYLNSGDGDREVDDFYATAYMMGEDELRDYLRIDFDDNYIDAMFNNSCVIGKRIKGYDIFHNPIIPQIPLDKIPDFTIKHKFKEYYDDYPIFGYYANRDDIHEQYFFYQLEEGLIFHVLNNPDKANKIEDYIKRCNTELDELKKIGEALNTSMVCYYSTMANICGLMWDCGSIVGCGRGSSAAFVITYLLSITQIDPVPLGDYMPYWRHMSYERGQEIADIDTDSEPCKKYVIIDKCKEYFGEDKVLNVATFSQISSKTALERACRGLGISADTANYMKSLVPVNRGKNASLKECYYGDNEKGIKPVYELVHEVEKYPELKEISLKLEGVLTSRSKHAAGLVISNQPYLDYLSAMRSPDGMMETSLNLFDAEAVSLVKFDLLTVSALQKIHKAMDLMLEKGVIEWQGSLKATYDKYLHPDVIDYTTPEMWEQLPNMYSVFQWDTPVSSKTLAAIKPKSIMDLSAGNSLLRLMPEGMDEPPVDRYIRYKEHPEQWEQEATEYGLTEDEKQIIRDICGASFYMAESQESIMRLAMSPKVAGYTLKEANKLRKSIARKSEKLQAEAKAQFFEWGQKQGTRDIFLKYVWEVLFAASMGYSFSSIHSYAYSVIALQELNIYYHYGAIYWNTACLSTEAVGSDEGSGNGQDYSEVSKAVYKMKKFGIDVLPPDINQAEIDFGCDEKEGKIFFGLGAIASINNDIATQIITNRPYTSFHDFYTKNAYKGSLITESKFLTLIKAGCFDEFDGGNRIKTMKQYIRYSTNQHTSLTTANLQEAIRIGCTFPKQLLSPYNFKKYVCSKEFFYSAHPNFKSKKLYYLDPKALRYFNKNCISSLIENVDYFNENDMVIVVDKSLEKLFAPFFESLKGYINTPEFLAEFNKKSMRARYDELLPVQDVNMWSFESCSFFSQENALACVDRDKYIISLFSDLPDEPQFVLKSSRGREWRQYELSRLAIVVLAKNDNAHFITGLDAGNNVVNIKFDSSSYAFYKQQISEQNGDSKTVQDKSWFTRGTMLLVTGYKASEDTFRIKAYKSSVFPHKVVKINGINKEDGSLDLQSYRYGYKPDE